LTLLTYEKIAVSVSALKGRGRGQVPPHSAGDLIIILCWLWRHCVWKYFPSQTTRDGPLLSDFLGTKLTSGRWIGKQQSVRSYLTIRAIFPRNIFLLVHKQRPVGSQKFHWNSTEHDLIGRQVQDHNCSEREKEIATCRLFVGLGSGCTQQTPLSIHQPIHCISLCCSRWNSCTRGVRSAVTWRFLLFLIGQNHRLV